MTFVYFLVYRHHTGILLDVQKTKRRLVAEIIASMHKVQTHEIEIYKQPMTQSLISYRIRIAFSIKKNDSLFLHKKNNNNNNVFGFWNWSFMLMILVSLLAKSTIFFLQTPQNPTPHVLTIWQKAIFPTHCMIKARSFVPLAL